MYAIDVGNCHSVLGMRSCVVGSQGGSKPVLKGDRKGSPLLYDGSALHARGDEVLGLPQSWGGAGNLRSTLKLVRKGDRKGSPLLYTGLPSRFVV